MAIQQLLASIREARFTHGIRCPRCGHDGCILWGAMRGRQRYRCRGCRRTFNDLTGTPAAFTKRLECWATYAFCLDACVSVRKAAALTRVHPTTSFRWRHRNLDYLRAHDPAAVAGWVELASAWFAYSEKGSRKLTRSPRRTGLREAWPSARLGVNVVIAADRRGEIVSATTGLAHARQPAFHEIEHALAGRIGARPILIAAEGPYGAASRLARAWNGEHQDARPTRTGPPHRLARLENAKAYRDRLVAWMKPFRGVATKYLPNYLAWHRRADRAIRQGTAATVLRWPVGSGFG